MIDELITKQLEYREVQTKMLNYVNTQLLVPEEEVALTNFKYNLGGLEPYLLFELTPFTEKKPLKTIQNINEFIGIDTTPIYRVDSVIWLKYPVKKR